MMEEKLYLFKTIAYKKMSENPFNIIAHNMNLLLETINLLKVRLNQ